MYQYQYPRPALTSDTILLTHAKGERHILLVQRKHEPFAGCWALPGGFVDEGETPHDAAIRELLEETGIAIDSALQFRTYGAPGRDPRGWCVTVAHVAYIDGCPAPRAGDDAALAQWFHTNQLPPLAFDHLQIITEALNAADNERLNP